MPAFFDDEIQSHSQRSAVEPPPEVVLSVPCENNSAAQKSSVVYSTLGAPIQIPGTQACQSNTIPSSMRSPRLSNRAAISVSMGKVPNPAANAREKEER